MLITSILSIIFILLSYYGIVRYATLYMKPVESYINKYSELPHANNKRVVISFTTTPEKINKIEPMIKSLLDQTVKVDMIVLNLPYKWKGEQVEDIPKYLNDVVNVFRYSKDYGDGGKLIPTLFTEKETDTIIIVVHDDVIYGQDFIQSMIEEVRENKDKLIVRKDSMVMTPGIFDCDVITKDVKNITNDWFISHSKRGYKTCDYIGNYKCI